MSDDASTSDSSGANEELSAPGLEEFPGWLRGVVESAAELSDTPRRVAVWIPTLAAVIRAGKSGALLATELGRQLETDELPEWPDEVVDEFLETLAEIVDVFPAAEEIIPAASELLEGGEQFVDSGRATETLKRGLLRAEDLTERMVRAVLDLAFFDGGPDDAAERNRNLRLLFDRLERIFDRLLDTWLSDDSRFEGRR